MHQLSKCPAAFPPLRLSVYLCRESSLSRRLERHGKPPARHCTGTEGQGQNRNALLSQTNRSLRTPPRPPHATCQSQMAFIDTKPPRTLSGRDTKGEEVFVQQGRGCARGAGRIPRPAGTAEHAAPQGGQAHWLGRRRADRRLGRGGRCGRGDGAALAIRAAEAKYAQTLPRAEGRVSPHIQDGIVRAGARCYARGASRAEQPSARQRRAR